MQDTLVNLKWCLHSKGALLWDVTSTATDKCKKLIVFTSQHNRPFKLHGVFKKTKVLDLAIIALISMA